ncbi:MAG: hypothetical protein A2086_00085 [Spirochaetes bacterium GWD1_27_9]|nr:MAG: hypothetical protein A2Z98_08400 [Spirochaetes bacterium GWB1_27_13]OHD36103.1 MAG: hypothetical protein A2086_00085 [Spirochaetes bacterium GWD1_27_9]
MSDCCKGGTKLVYACSGGSNVGQIANEVAKNLTTEGFAKMTCGIALGANLSGFIVSAENADKNIVIDGCTVGCLKKVFENHKISNYDYYVITEMGIEKNKNFVIDLEDIYRIKELIKTQGNKI